MSGCMDGWVGGWMGWMDLGGFGWVSGCMGWVSGWMDGWMGWDGMGWDGWMDGWMNGWGTLQRGRELLGPFWQRLKLKSTSFVISHSYRGLHTLSAIHHFFFAALTT